ncbi:YidC/Oxa1 family membrane protein insertase [Nocardioides marmoraquaticus]
MSVLDPVTHALAAVLATAHSALSSAGLDPASGLTWGLALAAVVVVARLCVLPLVVLAVRSAHAAARARPDQEALARRYRGRRDPDALREHLAERRRVAREHGVSRLGCLPALAQLPVWVGLFQLVSHAAAGLPTGLLDAALVASFGAATLAGVPLASSGYLGGGPTRLAVVAALAATAALLSYVTQRVFVAQNTLPLAVPDGARPALAEAMTSTQQLLPLASAAGLLLAGAVVPVALLVLWVAHQTWTLGWSAAVWRFAPTPGSPAAARRAR